MKVVICVFTLTKVTGYLFATISGKQLKYSGKPPGTGMPQVHNKFPYLLNLHKKLDAYSVKWVFMGLKSLSQGLF